jgi:hypothetical protein
MKLDLQNDHLRTFDASNISTRVFSLDLSSSKLIKYVFNDKIQVHFLNNNPELDSIEFMTQRNYQSFESKSVYLRNTSSKLINNHLNFTLFKLKNINVLDLSLNKLNGTRLIENGFKVSNFEKLFISKTGIDFTFNILNDILTLKSLDLSFNFDF